MHKLTIFSISIFLLLLQPLDAAKVFEGEYDMSFSGDGDSVEVAFSVKGGHMRMKVQGKRGDQSGEMILRDGASSMIMIMPQQRMYMEMEIPQGMFVADPPAKKETEEFPFEKTGKTREILGYTAREYIMEDGGETVTIWATDELGAMPFARNPMLEGWSAAMRRMTGMDAFFPLETIGTENGKQSFRMVVTRVEKKSLPDSLFEAPEGFMKLNMPAGMGGMFQGG